MHSWTNDWNSVNYLHEGTGWSYKATSKYVYLTDLQYFIIIRTQGLPVLRSVLICITYGIESLLNGSSLYSSSVKCLQRSDLTVIVSTDSLPHGKEYCKEMRQTEPKEGKKFKLIQSCLIIFFIFLSLFWIKDTKWNKNGQIILSSEAFSPRIHNELII